jgi:glycosyltransferase involved in cell wall biosynthesis
MHDIHLGGTGLRLGLLIGLAPRKLGSFEDWLLAFCREIRGRGHAMDVFGSQPIHPFVRDQLRQFGVGWKQWQALTASPVRSIATLASYDVLHLNMFGAYDLVSLLAYAALPARIAFVSHAEVPDTADILPKRVMRRAINYLISSRIDGLAGVSNYVRDRQSQWLGLTGSKVRTIYNGIDFTRFRSRTNPSRAKGGAVLLSIVNLVPWKGLQILLRALSKVRDPTVRLMIAGDGPEEKVLRELSRSLGLESRISFLGLRDDVPELLNQADILVHPATYGEPFGLAIAEAMAAECPVIASRVGGIPELIQHGQTGLLVTPGDDLALAGAIDALNENPEYRLQLATAARTVLIEQFGVDRCAREHLDWCEEIFRRPGKIALPGRLRALRH